jgi:acyl carrier protein
MSNQSKYDEIFKEVLELAQEQLNDQLEYQSVETWDSVGHMSLMAALEDEFDIMLEMDDIIDFGSYHTGIKTLEKYGVSFQ